VADYSGIGVTGFHHNIDPGREGMIVVASILAHARTGHIAANRTACCVYARRSITPLR
jgi:hypothetical protein